MRPFALLFAALTVVPGALAVDELKSVNFLVFDNKLSADQIAKARKVITDMGGTVTHDFHDSWG
ncbi:hypothetical protein CMUS01_08718 [Colletotrichum musicola]|uniref:Uncharacterized protein n=3 Tax=Colletotrichum orchidearum species complex TaxID=2707337 RepID=A0A8H6KBV8_9PEZI|nr:hypothetical protein CSOJ01_00331 [Colletotrichum sojae]KAF6828083.1 hypothetical protein CMUS01_08718 [Colletotrichum musicola]KAF6832106.1 hypothetical protein CPLU01_06352 [Colletotrichum plurivorum]